jgi:hypothetical protein
MMKKGEFTVAEKVPLSKETFLRIAENAGLDIQGSHREDLYAYLEGLLPLTKTLEDFDLKGLEPFMPSLTRKE